LLISCYYISVAYGDLVPKYIYVDIKPSSWPNPINIKSKGVFASAICGTVDFDVACIDPATVMLYINGIDEGVAPIRWNYEDVATPYIGSEGGGHDLDGDGHVDLVFHFDTRTVVAQLRLSDHVGETVPLFLKGKLRSECGGKAIWGRDYVWVIDLPGDVNSDASVNILDGVIISRAWSSTSNPGENWDPRADVNDDDEVNMLDAVVVALNWGKTP
jgi:hypothetical protein